MKAIILVLLAMISSGAYALETDNFIVWGTYLSSSRGTINRYFEKKINEAIEENRYESCKEIRSTLAKKFKSIGIHHNPIENYLVETLRRDAIYPKTMDYVHHSIYRNPFLPYLPSIGLSPNIQVNGIYFGTDKLSHFASTGYIYFLIYNYYQHQGEREAELKAITYGLNDEKSLHGYWASGVFSYADLEANYQGLQFYKNLCKKYVKKINGEWKLAVKPDIGEYISAYWDESFNRSYFVSDNWEKVRPVLKALYCYKNDRLLYRKAKKSFSQAYLEILGPRPQTIPECQRTKLQ